MALLSIEERPGAFLSFDAFNFSLRTEMVHESFSPQWGAALLLFRSPNQLEPTTAVWQKEYVLSIFAFIFGRDRPESVIAPAPGGGSDKGRPQVATSSGLTGGSGLVGSRAS